MTSGIEDLQDAEDRSIAVAIHQALVPSVRLELLPKSTVDVFITVIETDGMEGCISSGVVAASTALADAGIEMLGLVMSCSAVRVPSHFPNHSHLPQAVVGTETWLDPTTQEVQLSQGTLVLSCMPALGIITSLWESGQMKTEKALTVGSFPFQGPSNILTYSLSVLLCVKSDVLIFILLWLKLY